MTDRVPCLDGLRGLAALWVLVGHVMLLTGYRLPILSSPDLGVDLFMLLSGFLMVFHYQLREAREPWAAPSTWGKFWLRRFFRIAPLYYVALALALILGPLLFEYRSAIAVVLTDQAQEPARYLDRSVANIVAHATFLFGLLPDYAFRTALPDWSIGLEMQFYAAFPFLMMVIGRLGWLGGGTLIAIVGVVAGQVADSRFGFPMPSFLPLKLHVFLAGMFIAAALRVRPPLAWGYGAVAAALVLIPLPGRLRLEPSMARLALASILFGLAHWRLLPGIFGKMGKGVDAFLGAKPFYWLGELSYGVYLIHLLILIPAAALLLDFDPPVRFGLAVAITVIVSYGLAFVAHLSVERPGRDFGRWLLRKPLIVNRA